MNDVVDPLGQSADNLTLEKAEETPQHQTADVAPDTQDLPSQNNGRVSGDPAPDIKAENTSQDGSANSRLTQPPIADKTTSNSKADNTSKECTDGSLDLIVRDWHGYPIPDLPLRVLDVTHRRKFDKSLATPGTFPCIFNGKTNAKGKLPVLDGIKIGTIFEIQIRKDTGEYTLAGIGKISSKENEACLKSPKVKFEISTHVHEGNAGLADQRKDNITKNHNQVPEEKPNISRNPEVKPEVQNDRNSGGQPKAIVKDGLPNMYGQHTNLTAPPQRRNG